MFLTETRTLLREAFRRTFDQGYSNPDFRKLGTLSSLEGPGEQEGSIPMVWVDFQPATELQAVGIGHVEFSDPDDLGHVRAFTRWRFSGFATYTFLALSSLERDRMVDEFVKVIAFGREDETTSVYRNYIENNDLIGMTLNWHRISLTGRNDAQGTPWGSGEWVYEQTVQLEIANGEFISEGTTESLIPLSAIRIEPIGPAEDVEPVPFADQSGQAAALGEWR